LSQGIPVAYDTIHLLREKTSRLPDFLMPFPDEAFIPKPLWRKNHYRYHKWASIISIFSLGLHAYLPPGGGDCGVEKVDVLVAGVVGDATVPL